MHILAHKNSIAAEVITCIHKIMHQALCGRIKINLWSRKLFWKRQAAYMVLIILILILFNNRNFITWL